MIRRRMLALTSVRADCVNIHLIENRKKLQHWFYNVDLWMTLSSLKALSVNSQETGTPQIYCFLRDQNPVERFQGPKLRIQNYENVQCLLIMV